ARRIDKHAVHARLKITEITIRLAGREGTKHPRLEIANIGPLCPRKYGGEAAHIRVAGEYLPAIAHHGRECERFATPTSAKIHHLLTRCRAHYQASELRAFILNFDHAIAVKGKAWQVGPRGETQAPRRERAFFRPYARFTE